MKYVIQTRRLPGLVDHWSDTAWGGDDFWEVHKRAQDILRSNKMGITKVRIVEVLVELNAEKQALLV